MTPKRVVPETVSLSKAKTHLSRLVALEDTRPLRVPGKGKGRWLVGRNFDAPWPDGLLEDFEGR